MAVNKFTGQHHEDELAIASRIQGIYKEIDNFQNTVTTDTAKVEALFTQHFRGTRDGVGR